MRHAARLARLEKLSGKNSCPLCRLMHRHGWPDPARPTPRDPGPIVREVCKVCGARRTISLASYDEGSRPLWRLFAESTMEDAYADPRVWAAFQWASARSEAERAREEAERVSTPSVWPAAAHGRADQSREIRLRQRLDREADAAVLRAHARQARRYGETPFPELAARLEAAKGEDYGRLYLDEPFVWAVPTHRIRALQREGDAWARCAEAERIALGNVRPGTAEARRDCERRALAVIEEASREHDDREARRREEASRRDREWQELNRQPSDPPPPRTPC